MADYSIVELVVYGLIAYGGIITLMVSTLLNPPTNSSLAGARSIWLTPSVLCMGMLMFASGIITLDTQETIITTTSNATSEVWTETGTVTNTIQLINPIWTVIHFGMMMILIVYIATQIFNIFGKKPTD